MPILRRYLKLAGLPFGLILGLGTSLSAYFAWYDFLLTAVASGAAYAGVLAALGVTYERWFRRSVIGAIAFIALSVAAGTVVGSAIFLFVRDLPHGRWRRVADPPGEVVSVEEPPCVVRRNGRADRLVVTITTGARYARSPILSALADPWTRIDSTPVPSSSSTNCNPSDRSRSTPIKLGRVKGRYLFVEDYVDSIWRVYYLLMADNSVWEWEDGNTAYVSVASAFFMMALSAILSLVVSVETVRATGRLRRTNSASAAAASPISPKFGVGG